MRIKSFKKFLTEKDSVDAKIQKWFSDNPNLNAYDDEELVDKLVGMGATRSSAIAKLTKRFNGKFGLKEDMERDMNDHIRREINQELKNIQTSKSPDSLDALFKLIKKVFDDFDITIVGKEKIISSNNQINKELEVKPKSDMLPFDNVKLEIECVTKDNKLFVKRLQLA